MAEFPAVPPRLGALACSMCDKKILGAATLIRAGYTYFGQFVAHDLSREDFHSDSVNAPRDSNGPTNLLRSFLNLECLYGQGVAPMNCDREGIYADDGASFRMGPPGFAGEAFDVPLGKVSERPVAADLRNLENVIVRQVHAMLLKLHNVAVDALPKRYSPARRFREARERVCHQYQYLVRCDFLSQICHPDIYGSVLHDPMIDWDRQFSIPIEFSQAAFRFGHSMVRRDYDLQGDSNPVKLESLFSESIAVAPLPNHYAINWSHFLDTNVSGEKAMNINTSIVAPLFRVPAAKAASFRIKRRSAGHIVLPYLTLCRGAASRLASGQTARKALLACPIATDDPGPWADLGKYGLRECTPLWYYILLEGELSEHSGRLGPVGSRIVAEVIEGALWANQDSYLRKFGRCWEPDPWPTRDHGDVRIRTLFDVARVTGLA